ncbi:MAG: MFS transporter [Planctomycetaceae bacterium]|nr:MFS transporter [Planctomycetaceae bacterium]MBT4013479.1 MFS transporter [Planctomycetaceae bacterium]MBT5125576.1 MFS transporter [Planctomycetaceae bacterium]MBT5598715.1 MFS transporter [Planctomycetaceae bacterium]MBT5884627.1 MFS transporter [Planctomycetaceae bacterium]
MTNPARICIQILLLLCLAHFTVDIIATTILPLLPTMEEQMGLQPEGFLYGYIIWRITDSCSQMAFGFLGDRYRIRFIIWAGPLLALLCFSVIGYVESPAVMVTLLVLGGIGIAAFHPECAATAGNLSPDNRSRFMAMFALSGYLGQSIGPIYAGSISDAFALTFALKGLTWNFAWGLPILLIVTLGLRRTHTKLETQTATPVIPDTLPSAPLPTREMCLLFTSGIFRVMPVLGIPIVLSYLLANSGFNDMDKGAVASVFMAGLGIGGISCALGIGRNHQRLILWLPPLLATVPVVAIGYVDLVPWIRLTNGLSLGPIHILALTIGALQGIAMPVFISFAQQLMPDRQRLASSLTMGVTWGTATLIFYAAFSIFKFNGNPQGIYWFFGATCLICAITSSLLRPLKNNA